MENVDRSQLLADLELLKMGLMKTPMLEQSDCIVFDGANKWAYTLNEHVGCFVPIDLGITGAIIAEPLYKVLSKVTDEFVSVEQREDEVVIRGKKNELGIKCDPKLLLPIEMLERPDEDAWRPIPEGFMDAVALVESCVETAGSDWQLSSVHVTNDFLESANEYQACRVVLDLAVGDEFLLRHGHLQNIVKTGVSEYAVTPNWLHFKNSFGLCISCRKFVEPYIDHVGTLLSQSREGIEIELPEGLANDVEAALVFSNDTDDDASHKITVKFSENLIELFGEGLRGWYKSKYPISYKGDKVSFGVNPVLFNELLRKYKTCVVCENCLLIKQPNLTFLTEIKTIATE
jgi:hypothetical protein